MVLNLESIVRKDEQYANDNHDDGSSRVETGTSSMLVLGITIDVGCVNGRVRGRQSVYQVYIEMNRWTDEQVSKMYRCAGIGDEGQGSSVGVGDVMDRLLGTLIVVERGRRREGGR